MTTEKRCTGCGRVAAVGTEAAFCTICGNQLEDVAPANTFCPKCGNKLDDVTPDDAFCPKCGNRLDGVPPVAQTIREDSEHSEEQPEQPDKNKSTPWPEPWPESWLKWWQKQRALKWFVGAAAIWLLVLIGVCTASPTDDADAPGPAQVKAEPTPTPVALCLRNVEAAYLAELRHLTVNVHGGGSRETEKLMERLSTNPLMVQDARWRDDVAESMSLMSSASTTIMELQAPDSLNEIDRAAKRMARETEDVVRLHLAAFKDFEADRLEEGGRKFKEGDRRVGVLTGYLADLTDALLRVCDVE